MSGYDPFGLAKVAEEARKKARLDQKKPAPEPPPTKEEPPPKPEPGPKTILGRPRVSDDRTLALVDMLFRTVQSADVEVEAKIGLIMDRETGKRGHLPLLATEVCLNSEVADRQIMFESTLDVQVFKILNGTLNARVQSAGSGVSYKRTRESDIYYDGKLRLSRSWDKAANRFSSPEDSRAQRKIKLAHLNYLSPSSCPHDIRVSASKEESLSPRDVEGRRATKERLKDRLSYEFNEVSVDITTVHMYQSIDPKTLERLGEAPVVTYEVEVEILPRANLFDACNNRDRRRVEFLAQEVLDTTRMLTQEIKLQSLS